MTYKQYLQKYYKPSREDVGFMAGLGSAVLTFMLSIGLVVSFASGDFGAFWAALWIFTVTVGGAGVMFIIGTFVYWIVVHRK